MKVFLLRHAPAVHSEPDADRKLSPSGRKLAGGLARFVSGKRFYRYSEVWCSPSKRARQTAKPFLANGKSGIPLKVMDLLGPGNNPRDLIPLLRKSNRSLLVVGQNPHLAQLARLLMGTDQASNHQSFKKGGLFVFKRDHFSATGFSLAGYLPPESLGL